MIKDSTGAWLLVIGLLVGVVLGAYTTREAFNADLVTRGVKEYRVVDEYGHVELVWKMEKMRPFREPMALANTENLNAEYPVQVVFRSVVNGNWWTKSPENFLERMTRIV